MGLARSPRTDSGTPCLLGNSKLTEGLFDVRIKAGVITGITYMQESLRMELTRFDPERGGVLDVLQVDSNDGL